MDTNPNSILDLSETYNEIPKPLFARLIAADTETEFDDCLEELIAINISEMEKRANFITDDEEEKISCYLAMGLNIPSVLKVTQEAHSKGHVDITIESGISAFVRLGEAKIYRGYSYHLGGLEQLINRYSTGRSTRGFIFVYVKKANIKQIMGNLMKDLDKKKDFAQIADSCEHKKIRWSFNTIHRHQTGEEFSVLHLGINLYYKTA